MLSFFLRRSMLSKTITEALLARKRNFPYVLMIKPVYRQDGQSTPAAPTGTPSEEEESLGHFDAFVHDLMKVPSGSVLFDRFACPTPHSALDVMPRRFKGLAGLYPRRRK